MRILSGIGSRLAAVLWFTVSSGIMRANSALLKDLGELKASATAASSTASSAASTSTPPRPVEPVPPSKIASTVDAVIPFVQMNIQWTKATKALSDEIFTAVVGRAVNPTTYSLFFSLSNLTFSFFPRR
eukprot:m.535032 g.535032  ORF g.535032 m.535032 type:complete len:129 (-) comp57609_c0_seq26:204-590(-)